MVEHFLLECGGLGEDERCDGCQVSGMDMEGVPICELLV